MCFKYLTNFLQRLRETDFPSTARKEAIQQERGRGSWEDLHENYPKPKPDGFCVQVKVITGKGPPDTTVQPSSSSADDEWRKFLEGTSEREPVA